MPKIFVDLKAQRRFSKLPTQEKQKIIRAIILLKQGKFEQLNIKAMRLPKAKMFRVRVGNLRIIYEFNQTDKIFISTIDYRGNVY